MVPSACPMPPCQRASPDQPLQHPWHSLTSHPNSAQHWPPPDIIFTCLLLSISSPLTAQRSSRAQHTAGAQQPGRGHGRDGESPVHTAPVSAPPHTCCWHFWATLDNRLGFSFPLGKIYQEGLLGNLGIIHLKYLRHGQCSIKWGLKRPLDCPLGLFPRS